MTKKRLTFTQQFEATAVDLVIRQGFSVAEAARVLGLDENLLRSWTLCSQAKDWPVFGEELRRLRAENRRLAAERDVLKKAAAFFARYAK
jgi:transposase